MVKTKPGHILPFRVLLAGLKVHTRARAHTHTQEGALHELYYLQLHHKNSPKNLVPGLLMCIPQESKVSRTHANLHTAVHPRAHIHAHARARVLALVTATHTSTAPHTRAQQCRNSAVVRTRARAHAHSYRYTDRGSIQPMRGEIVCVCERERLCVKRVWVRLCEREQRLCEERY